MKKSGKAQMLQ